MATLKKKIGPVAITVGDAVRAAVQYVEALTGRKGIGARVEEVEPSTDSKSLLITLSYLEPPDPSLFGMSTFVVGGENGIRTYKVFKVNATNGQVRSMKIRAAP
jgi:hypothetical protein